MPPISIIIPAYNEEKGIGSTLTQLNDVMKQQHMECEIIVVDDGSTDATAKVVQQHDVLLLQHYSNRGYGAAIKTGIRQARHDWIAIIDADGTYPPSAIPLLLAKESDGYDMVIGARTREDIPLVRRPAKWFLARLAEYLAETKIPDLNSGLRVFRKDLALSYFNILPSRFSFTITITIAFLSDHYLVKFVPIAYHGREGKSKIRPIQDTLNFVQLMLRTVMYFNPLKVLLPVSFLLFLLSLIIGFYSLFAQGRVMDITVITLAMASIQIAVIAMIADMVQKKSKV